MIYIAGEISNLPIAEAQSNFEKAEMALRRLDLKVINPLKLGISSEATWEDQLTECKRVITKEAEAIFFLRNWKRSRGAREEYDHVDQLNKLPNREIRIYYEDKDGFRKIMRDINDKVLTCLTPSYYEK